MAKLKKKSAKTKPPKKPPLKKPSPKKKPSGKSPSKKSKKFTASKKSSKVATYEVVTLDARTKKQVKPRKGQEVYFALRSSRGKIHPIETEFPQKYSASDHKGIRAALASAAPDAFPIYQQLTRSPVFHYEGKRKVYEYRQRDGKPVLNAKGQPEKIYRYKLTGKKIRSKQRTVVMGVAGYLHATGVGFTKKTKTESAKGVVLLPVGRNKISSDIVLVGDTIKDTVKNLRPDIGTRDMVKRGIHRLGVYGAVTISRPGNPHRKGTPEYQEREAWAGRIWGVNTSVQVSFSRTIDRLANFADALSVTIREALSNQGLRVTSLMNLHSIYDTAVEQDDAMRAAGKRFRPMAGKILQRPATSHNRSAEELNPLRPENEFGAAMYKNNSKYNAGIKLNITVEALK